MQCYEGNYVGGGAPGREHQGRRFDPGGNLEAAVDCPSETHNLPEV